MGYFNSAVQMCEELVEGRLDDTREKMQKGFKGNGIKGAHMRGIRVPRCTGGNSCAAHVTAWSLNRAIDAQVVLGALTIGIAVSAPGRQVRVLLSYLRRRSDPPPQTSIAVSVLGGLSTLARMRGSEFSTGRCKKLETTSASCART